jgi:hypothetical protein
MWNQLNQDMCDLVERAYSLTTCRDLSVSDSSGK